MHCAVGSYTWGVMWPVLGAARYEHLDPILLLAVTVALGLLSAVVVSDACWNCVGSPPSIAFYAAIVLHSAACYGAAALACGPRLIARIAFVETVGMCGAAFVFLVAAVIARALCAPDDVDVDVEEGIPLLNSSADVPIAEVGWNASTKETTAGAG